jgi:DNA (cytosine-5)-methyltransferase 1
VLNTKDNAFGCFLAELVGADSPLSSGSVRWPCAGMVTGPKRKVAWRVLDAQHFGVPQRRRRVFIVASPAEGGGQSIPQRYFLSAKACLGILRRAMSRGKHLPPLLKAALERTAMQAEPQAL